jgi:hypothetical protein
MKITYTQFVPDPALRGTTTNLPAHIAQVLIASGQASAFPMPVRGSKEWLKARLEQSASANAPDVHDVSPTVAGVEWGVKEKSLSPWSEVQVIKKVGAEVFYFAHPPADCPRSIVARFKELTSDKRDVTAAEALDAAKRQQTEYDEKIKYAKRW